MGSLTTKYFYQDLGCMTDLEAHAYLSDIYSTPDVKRYDEDGNCIYYETWFYWWDNVNLRPEANSQKSDSVETTYYEYSSRDEVRNDIFYYFSSANGVNTNRLGCYAGGSIVNSTLKTCVIDGGVVSNSTIKDCAIYSGTLSNVYAGTIVNHWTIPEGAQLKITIDNMTANVIDIYEYGDSGQVKGRFTINNLTLNGNDSKYIWESLISDATISGTLTLNETSLCMVRCSFNLSSFVINNTLVHAVVPDGDNANLGAITLELPEYLTESGLYDWRGLQLGGWHGDECWTFSVNYSSITIKGKWAKYAEYDILEKHVNNDENAPLIFFQLGINLNSDDYFDSVFLREGDDFDVGGSYTYEIPSIAIKNPETVSDYEFQYDLDGKELETNSTSGTIKVTGEQIGVNDVSITVNKTISEAKINDKVEVTLAVIPETIFGLTKSMTDLFADGVRLLGNHVTSMSFSFPDLEFEFGKLSFSASNLEAEISKKARAYNLLASGDFFVTIAGFEVKATLSGENDDGNQYGITMTVNENFSMGSWDVNGKMELDSFKIGGFEFSDFALEMNTADNSVSANGKVKLPGINFAIGGGIGFKEGKFDSFSLGVYDLNKPVGTTGVFLQSISGAINGISEGGSELELAGTIGFSYGPKITIEEGEWLADHIAAGEYALVSSDITGTLKVDAIGGAGTVTILGGLVSGSVECELPFSGGLTMNGSFSMLGGMISVTGEMSGNHGNFTISGEGTFTLPEIGFMSEKELTGNALMVYSNNMSDSDDYVMAWGTTTILNANCTFGVKYFFDGKYQLIGVKDIDELSAGSNAPRMLCSAGPDYRLAAGEPQPSEKTFTLTGTDDLVLFTAKAAAGGVPPELVLTDAVGTEYTLATIQTGAYANLCYVAEMSGANSTVIAVSLPSAGVWKMASSDTGVDFSVQQMAMQDNTKPVISSSSVGNDERSVSLTVTASAKHIGVSSQILVYADRDNQGNDGILIASTGMIETAETSLSWNLEDDFAGGDFFFYSIVVPEGGSPITGDYTTSSVFLKTIDITPPDTPTGLAISIPLNLETQRADVAVTWNDQGNDAVKYEYVYQSGSGVFSDDETTLTMLETTGPNLLLSGGTLTAGVNYYLKVRAVDAAGNKSDWSRVISFIPESFADACTLSRGETMSGGTVNYALSANAGGTLENVLLANGGTITFSEPENLVGGFTRSAVKGTLTVKGGLLNFLETSRSELDLSKGELVFDLRDYSNGLYQNLISDLTSLYRAEDKIILTLTTGQTGEYYFVKNANGFSGEVTLRFSDGSVVVSSNGDAVTHGGVDYRLGTFKTYGKEELCLYAEDSMNLSVTIAEDTDGDKCINADGMTSFIVTPVISTNLTEQAYYSANYTIVYQDGTESAAFNLKDVSTISLWENCTIRFDTEWAHLGQTISDSTSYTISGISLESAVGIKFAEDVSGSGTIDAGGACSILLTPVVEAAPGFTIQSSFAQCAYEDGTSRSFSTDTAFTLKQNAVITVNATYIDAFSTLRTTKQVFTVTGISDSVELLSGGTVKQSGDYFSYITVGTGLEYDAAVIRDTGVIYDAKVKAGGGIDVQTGGSLNQVVIESGGTVTVSSDGAAVYGASVCANGGISLADGSEFANLRVAKDGIARFTGNSSSTVQYSENITIAGRLAGSSTLHYTGYDPSFTSIVLDVSGLDAAGNSLIEDWDSLKFGGRLEVLIDPAQPNGTWRLLDGCTSFTDSILLRDDSNSIYTYVSPGTEYFVGDTGYLFVLDQASKSLSLKISEFNPEVSGLTVGGILSWDGPFCTVNWLPDSDPETASYSVLVSGTDGGIAASLEAVTGTSASFDIVNDGAYIVTVSSKDAAGNVLHTSSRTFGVEFQSRSSLGNAASNPDGVYLFHSGYPAVWNYGARESFQFGCLGEPDSTRIITGGAETSGSFAVGGDTAVYLNGSNVVEFYDISGDAPRLTSMLRVKSVPMSAALSADGSHLALGSDIYTLSAGHYTQTGVSVDNDTIFWLDDSILIGMKGSVYSASTGESLFAFLDYFYPYCAAASESHALYVCADWSPDTDGMVISIKNIHAHESGAWSMGEDIVLPSSMTPEGGRTEPQSIAVLGNTAAFLYANYTYDEDWNFTVETHLSSFVFANNVWTRTGDTVVPDDSVLVVGPSSLELISGSLPKSDVVYINPEWAGLKKGTAVKISTGETASIGIDAAASPDYAASLVASGGKIVMDSVSPIVFSCGASGASIDGNVYSAGDTVQYEDVVVTGTIFGGNVSESETAHTRYLSINGSTVSKRLVGGSPIKESVEQTGETGSLSLYIGGKNSFATVVGANCVFTDAVLRQNSSLVISDADSTAQNVFGGNYLSTAASNGTAFSVNEIGDVEVNLTGVTVSTTLSGGSYVVYNANDTRTGNISTTLNGGSYGIVVGGNIVQASTGKSLINGNVNLTLAGGMFNKRIYTAGFASNKNNTEYSRSLVNGDTCLTIDASAEITLNASIYAGGSGYNHVAGNSKVTFTGTGSNIVFDDKSFVSGDSQSARLTNAVWDGGFFHGGKYIQGERELAFSGFTGDFNTANVTMFDAVSISDSTVNFAKTMNLSEITNWKFTSGEADTIALTWMNGQNDFTEDTISINTSLDSWSIMQCSSSDMLNIMSAKSVILNGVQAENDDESTWFTATASITAEEQDDGTAILKYTKLA